jgi:hypothetical protein
MEVGCGNGSGLGLVSHKLLAGELTPGYGVVQGVSFFLSFFCFFSFLSLFPWTAFDACGFSSLGYTAFVWIPFVFSLSETETRPSRLHWQSYIKEKKHLQLYLCLSPLYFSQPASKRLDHIFTMHAMPLAQPAAAASHDLQNHPTLAYILPILLVHAHGEKVSRSHKRRLAHNASNAA